jgi:hypothetical protein
MKKKSFIVLTAILFFALKSFTQLKDIAAYNVVWTAQSKNSSESMPCGGGDIGLNVWVENGDILFYLSRSGTFDENNQMLKLGRMRLHLSSTPFAGKDFKQELKLQDGIVSIKGKNVDVILWVDVFRPVVHVDIQSKQAIDVLASYESWRYEDRIVKGAELRANSYKVPQLFDIITYKDSVRVANNRLLFYHRNRNDKENIFDYTVRMEGIDSVKKEMYDPVANNTFGGILTATNMFFAGNDTGTYANTSYRSWKFKTVTPVKLQQIQIALNVSQSPTLNKWRTVLNTILFDAQTNSKTAFLKTKDWWHRYWNRSYIVIEGKDSFISRNYALFRYQLGCNAYGKWPTKFNGGLFTFDPLFVDAKYTSTPDFRLWGGGTMTAQNQRLVYYPMLKNGDFDMMQSQLDTYLRMLHNAELRSKVYWNHDGACFTEQLESFGLPNIFEYNIKRPADFDKGVEYNLWLEYTWETVFEFCLMMLDEERYQGYNIKKYIPFIESCLTFYDEHYRHISQFNNQQSFNKKWEYIFYPGSAAETYKGACNSTTVISALKTILTRVTELPVSSFPQLNRKKWEAMLQHIPAVPLQQVNGKTVLAPAISWTRIQNTESPQLYPVFPWGIYGIGKPDLQIAVNTYQCDSQVIKTRSAIGWRQHNIFAARLGLTQEAVTLTREKFANGKHRFSAFFGPGFDWTPDCNWGGSAMIGLQEMLMQVDNKKIYLLPAWPKEWDGKFKLHAPYKTVIQAEIKNGKLLHLTVSPKEREKDIIVLAAKSINQL